MRVVCFWENGLLDESGTQIKIEEKKLLKDCLENADISIHVIEIVRHTLRNLGYELETSSYKYRQSNLFNRLECAIVASEKYQRNKNESYKRVKRETSATTSIISYALEMRIRESLRDKSRRPGRYSMKAD